MDLLLAVHPEQPVGDVENVHIYSYACLYIRKGMQEVTDKGEAEWGENSELKIEYWRTDYHNKG